MSSILILAIEVSAHYMDKWLSHTLKLVVPSLMQLIFLSFWLVIMSFHASSLSDLPVSPPSTHSEAALLSCVVYTRTWYWSIMSKSSWPASLLGLTLRFLVSKSKDSESAGSRLKHDSIRWFSIVAPKSFWKVYSLVIRSCMYFEGRSWHGMFFIIWREIGRS